MIRHDLTCWPLVVSRACGITTLADQLDFLAHWTCWLDRGEPFVALRAFTDDDAHLRPRGGAQEMKAWLWENGGRLRRLVGGIATVVLPGHYERMSRIDAGRLFGVPARLFVDIGAALDWIEANGLMTRRVKLDRSRIIRGLEDP